jgi:hypothetical protein
VEALLQVTTLILLHVAAFKVPVSMAIALLRLVNHDFDTTMAMRAFSCCAWVKRILSSFAQDEQGDGEVAAASEGIESSREGRNGGSAPRSTPR